MYTRHLIQVIPDLVALDGLLCLRVGLVSVVKSNLQLVDVSLQFLLDPASKSVLETPSGPTTKALTAPSSLVSIRTLFKEKLEKLENAS